MARDNRICAWIFTALTVRRMPWSRVLFCYSSGAFDNAAAAVVHLQSTYQCELEDLGKAAILIICISTDFTAGTIQPLVAQVLPAELPC